MKCEGRGVEGSEIRPAASAFVSASPIKAFRGISKMHAELWKLWNGRIVQCKEANGGIGAGCCQPAKLEAAGTWKTREGPIEPVKLNRKP